MPFFVIISFVLLAFTLVGAYLTHIWWTISTLMGDAVVTIQQATIMIVGTIAVPLGTIHGIWLWFN